MTMPACAIRVVVDAPGTIDAELSSPNAQERVGVGGGAGQMAEDATAITIARTPMTPTAEAATRLATALGMREFPAGPYSLSLDSPRLAGNSSSGSSVR